jgi:hypothetical protein
MTHLHIAVVRASDHLKDFCKGYFGAKLRRRFSRIAQPAATIYRKRSFLG